MTEDLASGVGAQLAQAREAQGLAVADVAQQLKFAPRQLEALEQERFGELPGVTFARGMVRNYARLLKLDPAPLLEQVAQRFATPDSNHLAARFRQPVPFSDSGRRSTMLYLGISLGILAAVGGIAYQWHQERARAASVSFVAAANAPQVDVPRTPPIAAQPASAVPPAPPIAEAPFPPPKEIAAQLKPQLKEVVAASTPASGVYRIVLYCDEDAWLEVTDSVGRNLISSLNRAGTERMVRGSRPPFNLVIGNARHVRLTYNDHRVDLAPHTKVEVARLTLK